MFEVPGQSSPSEPIRINHTLVASAGRRMSHILHLDFMLREKESGIGDFESRLIPLSANIPDSDVFFELIKGYRNTFMDGQSSESTEKRPLEIPNTYVGNQVCAACHKYEYHVWKCSQHAVPFKKQDREPEDCLECHGTGFGFITPDDNRIGCEACHGPGKHHSVFPKSKGYGNVSSTKCRACHTNAQSPNFTDFSYWLKINH